MGNVPWKNSNKMAIPSDAALPFRPITWKPVIGLLWTALMEQSDYKGLLLMQCWPAMTGVSTILTFSVLLSLWLWIWSHDQYIVWCKISRRSRWRLLRSDKCKCSWVMDHYIRVCEEFVFLYRKLVYRVGLPQWFSARVKPLVPH